MTKTSGWRRTNALPVKGKFIFEYIDEQGNIFCAKPNTFNEGLTLITTEAYSGNTSYVVMNDKENFAFLLQILESYFGVRG